MVIWGKRSGCKDLSQEEAGLAGRSGWGDEEQGAGRARPVREGFSQEQQEQLLKGSKKGSDKI